MAERMKIVAVTGARSEYDLMYSIYEKLNAHDQFDFSILVTGPHLSENFGSTVDYIIRDGFRIEDQLFNLVDSNKRIGRILSLGYQIPALAHAFNRVRPDLVLVAGDREEAMSVTMTSAYMDIPVAHFFGGDIAKDGNIDNAVRYASGKFAHLHFVTVDRHRETLLKLGEDDWRIHVIGNPALDRLLSTVSLSKKEVFARIKANFNEDAPYAVVIQHSIISEVELQKEHIVETLEAIVTSGLRCFLNYPNSDPGNFDIIQAYDRYERMYPDQFKTFKNLDRDTYVNLLRHAAVLVGNSSSGLLEAPSLKLPAVNVGKRQRGRLHGENVLFVDNDREQIAHAIELVLTDPGFRKKLEESENPYGDGNSSDKVIRTLESLSIDDQLIHKNITY
jgi:GDP/UDP-N,N'-diacetylbacillosamine 2-epimerase (hydrolysing)